MKDCPFIISQIFGGIFMIFRDAVHGDISFTNAEERLISNKAFRRLHNIHQLGFVREIFPCATHTRYQHSLGVANCVTEMYEAICKNCPSFYREGDIELLRAMALVHDIGHAPFSHASEELSTIEHEERLTNILEYMKKDIIIPCEYGIEPWELVNEVYQGIGLTYLGDKHLMVLHSLLDGFIDADKLDYLERDAYFCGVKYGNFDRQDLIKNLTIEDDKIAILSDGINAFESFVLARYYMFNQVYFHPTERIVRKMYCKEMKGILKDGYYPEDVRKFLSLDDTKYISKLKCIQRNPFKLLYEGVFDADFQSYVKRFLGKFLVMDVPFKNIFRTSENDTEIYVIDKTLGTKKPCTEVSPLLKSIEFGSIHRLRIYTYEDDYDSVLPQFQSIVSKYNTQKGM